MSQKYIFAVAEPTETAFQNTLKRKMCSKQITAIQKLFYAFLFSKGQIAVVTLHTLQK